MRRTVILFWSEDRFSCLFCIGILSLNWNLKLTQVISFIMLSLFYYVEFLLLWHWHKHEMVLFNDIDVKSLQPLNTVLFHSFYSRLCRFPWSVMPGEICDQSQLDLSFCSSQDRVQRWNMIFIWAWWEFEHYAASDEKKHPNSKQSDIFFFPFDELRL